MVTPEQIRKKAERWYVDYLVSVLREDAFFPRDIPSDKNTSGKNISDLHQDLTPLLREAKNTKGWGYRVEMNTVETRRNGRQTLPGKILFETEADYLRFSRKENEVRKFRENAALIRREIPALEQWLVANPLQLIRYEAAWPQLLCVCRYFIRTPRPELYIRELPVNVHTKFIEQHKGILRSLLDDLIAEHIRPDEVEFEKRFHLKKSEPLIRMKLLDDNIARMHFSGIADLTITQPDFDQLSIPVERVIMLENKTNFSNIYNFLTLPHLQNSLAVFGRGFAAGTYIQASWLRRVKVYYWGDIDTHGLLILNYLRKYLPGVVPVLMDKFTLFQYESDWSAGEPTLQENPEYLLPEEKELFHFLRERNIRLEQEKIRQDDVVNVFKRTI